MRILELFQGENLLFRCSIQLGFQPIGHKTKQGDGKTPEGLYHICTRNPQSKFHKSVCISYPQPKDLGALDPGNHIMIHSFPNHKNLPDRFYKNRDWTDGCISIEREYAEFIFDHCPNDTPIFIYR